MTDRRDRLELASGTKPPHGASDASSADQEQSAPGSPRPWLQLWFECCHQYARAYKQPDGSAYLGRCPRCFATIRFPIGEGGTSQRSFRVHRSA